MNSETANEFAALDQLTSTAKARLEQALDHYLPAQSAASRLSQAMRYAALSGGKRIRPLLVYGAAQLAGASPAQADVPAVAVELIHAYSLVHDDLPVHHHHLGEHRRDLQTRTRGWILTTIPYQETTGGTSTVLGPNFR